MKNTEPGKILIFLCLAVLGVLVLPFCRIEEELPADVDGPVFVFLNTRDRMTVGASGFVMKDQTGSVLFGGTSTRMANLFSKLTITYTNIPEKASSGTILFTLPLEGTIMPVLSGNSAVPEAAYATFMELNKPLAAGGACPVSTTDYTGRMRPNPALTRDTFLYGLGRIAVGTDARLAFQTKMVLMTGDFSTPPDYTEIMSGFIPSGESAVNAAGASLFFTPSGAALVREGTSADSKAYFLLPSAPATAAEITANGVEYRGWVEFPVPDGGKFAQPIAFRGDGTRLTGGPYTRFGQNEVDTTRVLTFGASEAAPPGLFDMSLQTREGFISQNRRTVAAKIGGRILLIGVGDRDGNNDGILTDPAEWMTSFLVQMNP